MNYYKAKLYPLQFECQNCGNVFNSYVVPDFSYGALLLYSIGSSKHYFIESAGDTAANEMYIILLSIIDVEKQYNDQSEVYSKLIGVCLDRPDGKYLIGENYMVCSKCQSEKMNWNYGTELEDVTIPVATHSEWDKLTYEEKYQKVYNAIIREGYILK